MNKTFYSITAAVIGLGIVVLTASIILISINHFESKKVVEEIEEICCDGRCGEEIDDATGQYILDMK